MFDAMNGNLKQMLIEALEQEVQSGNVKVMLWLAERMKIVTQDPANDNTELSEILSGLSVEELKEYQGLRDK